MSRKTIVNNKNPYENAFAKRIRDLLGGNNRFGKSITQEEIASVMGVTRQAVGQYYNGATYPTIDKIEKLADYFEVSTDYILGRTDVKSSEMDIRIIAEKTGLSELAINSLVNFEDNLAQEPSPFTPETVNYMKGKMLEDATSTEDEITELLDRIVYKARRNNEEDFEFVKKAGVKYSDYINATFPDLVDLVAFAKIQQASKIISHRKIRNKNEDDKEYSLTLDGVLLEPNAAVDFFSSRTAINIEAKLKDFFQKSISKLKKSSEEGDPDGSDKKEE